MLFLLELKKILLNLMRVESKFIRIKKKIGKTDVVGKLYVFIIQYSKIIEYPK